MGRSPYFTVRERFGSSHGSAWSDYLAWANQPNLSEVVSLDISLCPSTLDPITADDWAHVVLVNETIDFFADLSYVLRRSAGMPNANVLRVIDEPTDADVCPFVDGFDFEGFDLVEGFSGMSAVTNCGDWKGLLSPELVGRNGLIPDFGRATGFRADLLAAYPDEPHANCVLWAVWRLRDNT